MLFISLYYSLILLSSVGAHRGGHNYGNIEQVEKRENSDWADSSRYVETQGLIADVPVFFHSAIKEVNEILRMYVERLKGFVQYHTFLNYEFEIAADKLEARISKIGSWVQLFSPYHRNLAGRYRFAENLFTTMSNSTTYLRFLNTDDQGADLVYEAIHLNISILALHNWKGLPGMARFEYAENIIKLREQLRSLRKSFSNLGRVSLCVHIMFDLQCEKATRAFQVSERFVVGSEFFADRE